MPSLSNSVFRYFVLYKPAGMLSQFVSPYSQVLLGQLDYAFPPGTQAVGRLDYDSEGLLILTNDGSLTRTLLHPSQNHVRRYFVLVAGRANEEHLRQLAGGVSIKLKKKGDYLTDPCEASILNDSEKSRYSADFDHPEWETWLDIQLKEGKNRQIRKMCSEQRLRVKRLIRVSIEDLSINSMLPGDVIEYQKDELFRLLHLSARET